jgi:ATP synthase I chain.
MSLRINKYTAEELKAMLPFIAATNGAVILVSLVLGFFYGFDWTVYSGLAVGNILMLVNFVLIGFTVDKIVKCRDFRRGRAIGGVSYGLRYAGMFAILAGLLTLGAVNIVTALVPLVYPKIYYTFIYTLTRGKEDE